MPNLVITYSDATMNDYNGVAVTTRTYCSKIDGKDTGMCASCVTTAVDATMRQKVRDLLTDRGFTWTTEV